MQATYIRQQSASKCLNAGFREVNYLNAVLVVGQSGSVVALDRFIVALNALLAVISKSF